jgi:uncharacterized membrane protein
MNKSRVEAFSDGVFAIAITLLVLTIAQPNDYRILRQQLANHWYSLAAYVVSFAIIGIMWLNHHSIFTHFERIDRGLFYLNLFLLMTITFLPYPTGVLGEALAKGRGTQTAAVFYGITMTVNAIAWAGLWLYGSHKRRLLRATFPEEERALATLLFTIGVVMYTLAVGVAFWNAYVFLGLQAAVALYYALDPVSRRPGRGKRDGGPAVEGSDSERPLRCLATHRHRPLPHMRPRRAWPSRRVSIWPSLKGAHQPAADGSLPGRRGDPRGGQHRGSGRAAARGDAGAVWRGPGTVHAGVVPALVHLGNVLQLEKVHRLPLAKLGRRARCCRARTCWPSSRST